jgi:uncharacterized protein
MGGPRSGLVQRVVRWQRVAEAGRDECSLLRSAQGFSLEGVAFLQLASAPAELHYSVLCAMNFCTQRARVSGTVGLRSVAFEISKSARGWHMNGALVAGLEACVDLDLGFTPATNLLPIRRLALLPGQAADAPAAWLDVARATLTRLPQRYERRGALSYWYTAPSVGYEALLSVDDLGFVIDYPGLWQAAQDPNPDS